MIKRRVVLQHFRCSQELFLTVDLTDERDRGGRSLVTIEESTQGASTQEILDVAAAIENTVNVDSCFGNEV